MTSLKKIELEDGQWVYVQVDETVTLPEDASEVYDDSGFERKGMREQANQAVDTVSGVIQAMSESASKVLEASTFGQVEKMTLEFGVKLGGEAGVPFITSGKAEGSVNVKIEFKPKEHDGD